ncbi:hypothetical protein JCM6882_009334 [Rhodosporidiobolus microsporus]
MLSLVKVAAAGAALLSVASPSRAQAVSGFALEDMDTIFSFGDSYSAIGYDPSKGVKELPLLGGTTTGGLNWIHYLALSSPKTNNSYFDFAKFGATVNNSIVMAASDSPPDFVTQVDTWEEYFVAPAEKEVKWNPETTLFTVFFGINDIGFTSLQHLNATEKIPAVVESYGNLLGKLYENGARNFLILLMPPTWRTPYIRSFGDEMATTFVQNIASYTSGLEALAASLPAQYPGLKLATYDTKPLFHAVLDDPSAFGFDASVANQACVAYFSKWPYTNPDEDLEECGAPLKEYIWMDEYHPTYSVHKLMAEAVAEALSVSPPTAEDSSFLAQIASALSSVQASLPASTAAASAPSSATDAALPSTDIVAASSLSVEEPGATPSTVAIRRRFRQAALSGPARLDNPHGAKAAKGKGVSGGRAKPLVRGKWSREAKERAVNMRRRWSGL